MDNFVSSAAPGPNSGPGVGHNQPPEEKITGTISEAADVLGIGKNQAYEAAHRGDIPTIRIGKSIRVKWQEFLRDLGVVS